LVNDPRDLLLGAKTPLYAGVEYWRMIALESFAWRVSFDV